jgi:superfamily II DNA or RNA helicase
MSQQIKIARHSVFAKLEKCTGQSVDAVAAFLTMEVKGAKYMPRFKSGAWDGRISLFNRRLLGFPAGLTSRVVEHLRSLGYVVDVVANGSRPGTPLAAALIGVTLHPFQSAAAEKAITETRAFIKSPTGSGKTEMGIELLRRIGLPTLWVCHRKELMRQTADRITERLGIPVGKIGDAFNDTNLVTVGITNSINLITNSQWWEQWKVLILDETHHASADTWYLVAMRCVNASWRYGLSATPLTGDQLRDWKLEGATGSMISVATTDELIHQGFLAKPTMRMLVVPRSSYPNYIQVRDKVAPSWRDNPIILQKLGGALYGQAYTWGITENAERNVIIKKVAVRHASAGERVMILCTRIKHGKRLCELMEAAGITSWFLSGEENTNERAAVMKVFKENKGCVLVASTIFQEGVDMPHLDTLILAGGGLSEMVQIQRVGRALRIRADKTSVLIYDTLDGCDPSERRDYLAQHTKQRIQTYQGQKFDVVSFR